MTRQEIEQNYTVENGRITSPGKFEGESVFVPYFWEVGLDGGADRDDGRVYTFKFKRDDAELIEWPELKKWLNGKRTLHLYEDTQGFVHCA